LKTSGHGVEQRQHCSCPSVCVSGVNVASVLVHVYVLGGGVNVASVHLHVHVFSSLVNFKKEKFIVNGKCIDLWELSNKYLYNEYIKVICIETIAINTWLMYLFINENSNKSQIYSYKNFNKLKILFNCLLFWSFCTWLILLIYSLTNKEYMLTCLVFYSDI
jgi:hypothetical protein